MMTQELNQLTSGCFDYLLADKPFMKEVKNNLLKHHPQDFDMLALGWYVVENAQSQKAASEVSVTNKCSC
jgi:hypothetical protein